MWEAGIDKWQMLCTGGNFIQIVAQCFELFLAEWQLHDNMLLPILIAEGRKRYLFLSRDIPQVIDWYLIIFASYSGTLICSTSAMMPIPYPFSSGWCTQITPPPRLC